MMSTKERILALLEGSRGQSISGELIAGQLNISRNAVWKAVKELEKDGYKIKAATNKGYSLCVDNDILSAQGIAPFLQAQEFSNGASDRASDKISDKKIFVYPSPFSHALLSSHLIFNR